MIFMKLIGINYIMLYTIINKDGDENDYYYVKK